MMRRAVCLLAAFIFLSVPVFSGEWVLAVSAFDGDKDFSTVIPKLILQEIPDGLTRLTTSDELYEDWRKEMLAERSSLQSKMQSKIAERDGIIFNQQYSQFQKNTEILKCEREILSFKEQIEANIEEYNDGFYSEEQTEASVVLWQKSRDSLYTMPSGGNPSGVDGVITGTISRYGDYLHVKAQLTLYPGAIKAGSFESAASLKEADLLASEIAAGILETVVNTPPVSIEVNVLFEDEDDQVPATVRIDGNKLSSYSGTDSNRRQYHQGVHEISVTAPGYRDKVFYHDFSDSDWYTVTVTLRKQENIQLTLDLSDSTGLVSYSGISAGDTPADIYVNGLPLMGQVSRDDGVPGFFYVEKPSAGDNLISSAETVITLAGKASSSDEIIEKSRKSMYTAFGLFIVSLPVSLITYGILGSAVNGWKAGSQSEKVQTTVQVTQALTWLTAGVSVAFGLNWGHTLAMYVKAADTLLPEIINPAEEYLPE